MTRTIDDTTDDIIETQGRLFEDASNLTVKITDIESPVKFKECDNYDKLYGNYDSFKFGDFSRFSFIPSNSISEDDEVVIITLSKDIHYEERIVIPYKALVKLMDYMDYEYVTDFIKHDVEIDEEVIHFEFDGRDYVTENMTFHEFRHYTLILSFVVVFVMFFVLAVLPDPTLLLVSLLIMNLAILYIIPPVVKRFFTFNK